MTSGSSAWIQAAAAAVLIAACSMALPACGPEIGTRTPDPYRQWDGHPDPAQGYQFGE